MEHIINADKLKSKIASRMIRGLIKEKMANAMIKLIDKQESAFEGVIKNEEHVYRPTAYVKPKERNCGKLLEEVYLKYQCPVCEILGNKHQILPGEKNCPMCNVNIYWEKEI